ncbi:MAG: hypothetical protein ACK5IQ_08365 [Bacteroidales bacterium]
MKTKLFLSVLFTLCYGFSGIAQIKENVVKWNLVNLSLGSLSLGYERALNEKNSVNLNVGIPIGAGMPSALGEALVGDDYTISKSKLNNFHIRAAYRHYTGQQSVPKGFYYEPSLKYQTLSPDVKGSGDVNVSGTNVFANIEADATLSTFTAGFQIGYQFLIADRVIIDLGIFGLEAGMGKLKMTATSDKTEVIDAFEKDIIDAVEDLPFGNPTVTRNGDKIEVTTKNIFLPMVRMNIGIGIAF